MKYSALINLAGIHDAGLSDKTDLSDWVIIDYILEWGASEKATKRGNKVWINYRHLIAQIPILGIKSKSAISARLKKLAGLGLLDIEHDEEGRIFASIGEIVLETKGYKANRSPNEHPVHENEHPVHENEHRPVLQNEHSIENQFLSGNQDPDLEACVPPTPKKRATRLPADWAPTPDQIAWARSERKDINPATEASKFRDYWIAKAGRDASKLDWDATWRNWVRNAKAGVKAANGSEPDWMRGGI